MLSYVGIFVMLVGAVVVFIDSDYGKKPEAIQVKAEPDKRIDTILSEIAILRSECNQEELKAAMGQLSKKHEALDLVVQTVKHQKPPVIQVSTPEVISVEIKKPVQVGGSLDLQTPEGKRLRVLHKEVKPVDRKKQLEKVKQQLERLSK